jgi:hypothetical protein
MTMCGEWRNVVRGLVHSCPWYTVWISVHLKDVKPLNEVKVGPVVPPTLQQVQNSVFCLLSLLSDAFRGHLDICCSQDINKGYAKQEGNSPGHRQ